MVVVRLHELLNGVGFPTLSYTFDYQRFMIAIPFPFFQIGFNLSS